MDEALLREQINAVRNELVRVIRGKDAVVDLMLNAVLAGGSVLMDDVPGVGKTTLAKALAVALNVQFKRIQFTPDLLPADVLGGSIYNPKTAEFVMHKGPVFTNIVLADEINRASPRTQSALLEAMNEKQVTLEGKVYPLPEAQLDRFYMKLTLGYPDETAEMAMLTDRLQTDPGDSVKPILCEDGLRFIREYITRITVEDSVAGYILAIIRKTREDSRIQLGASPRAFLTLTQCARTRAWLQNRSFITPDDVKELAVPVLAHRLVMKEQGVADEAGQAVRDILKQIRIPA